MRSRSAEFLDRCSSYFARLASARSQRLSQPSLNLFEAPRCEKNIASSQSEAARHVSPRPHSHGITSATLTNILDPLAEHFRAPQPTFYAADTTARIIIPRPGGLPDAEKPPTLPVA